ncbi:MAG TPA: hypothetical protein VMW76_02140 [Bacteroidales bacterium]|nr:hypothetical protein [Bacteroidales bacterium]
MKANLCKPLLIIGLLFIVFSLNRSYGQDSLSQKSQMLDVKLQLLDSKLELLDLKIKLWEAKPKELDIKLNEIGNKINSMDFEPQMVTQKLKEIDSLLKVRQEPDRHVELQPQVLYEPEPEFIPDNKSAIMLDPVRLFEGTFYISYERILNSRFSVNVAGMATYSTKRGISNYYFSNQLFAFFNKENDSYTFYEGEVMAGGGLNVQFRNYLLANHPNRQKAPLGLYAAPQLMYRKMVITGNYREMEEVEPGVEELVDKKITQHLNIFAGGVILGMKVPLFKVLTVDLFAGGNIRMSKYNNEDGFTKYKDWFNFDFSGVSPVAGIAVGILK